MPEAPSAAGFSPSAPSETDSTCLTAPNSSGQSPQQSAWTRTRFLRLTTSKTAQISRHRGSASSP